MKALTMMLVAGLMMVAGTARADGGETLSWVIPGELALASESPSVDTLVAHDAGVLWSLERFPLSPRRLGGTDIQAVRTSVSRGQLPSIDRLLRGIHTGHLQAGDRGKALFITGGHAAELAAAAWLYTLGHSPERALKILREAAPGAMDSAAQRDAFAQFVAQVRVAR